ncbi:MAG: TonB family protein [Gammaproteobacteria bacterium]|nr:TonB family protein [Gammaproteobacteria bacterium]
MANQNNTTPPVSEQEQALQEKYDETKIRLDIVEHEYAEINAAMAELDAKDATAQALKNLSQQLSRLGDLPPLTEEGHLFFEDVISPEQLKKRSDAYAARIDRQLTALQSKRAEIKKQYDEKRQVLSEAREITNTARAELDKIRPLTRAQKYIINDAEGRPVEFVMYFRHTTNMPWNRDEDDKRYNRIRWLLLLLAFLLAFLIDYYIDRLPVREIPKVVILDDRFAQLIKERKPPPPPPPPPPKKETDDSVKKDDGIKPEKKAPGPKNDAEKQAREKASRSGLLAFQDSFADLMDNDLDQSLGKNARVTADGANARKTERSLITSARGGSSGGVAVAGMSRDVGGSGFGGTGLGSRGTQRMTGVISDEFGDANEPLAQDSVRGSRTDEEVQIVFDRNKSSLYQMYQRALRTNPTLRGKVVLKLTISPSGSVTNVSVESSELKDPELEAKIATRVRLFNFGPKDVDSITIRYPIEFFPQ